MCAEDNSVEHLYSALYGPPQTKPDERRKYMGSLRERVALCMCNVELADPKRQHVVLPFLKDSVDRNYKALLYGKLDKLFTGPYMKLLSELYGCFTLVLNETAQTLDTAPGRFIVAATLLYVANMSCSPLDDTQENGVKKWF